MELLVLRRRLACLSIGVLRTRLCTVTGHCSHFNVIFIRKLPAQEYPLPRDNERTQRTGAAGAVLTTSAEARRTLALPWRSPRSPTVRLPTVSPCSLPAQQCTGRPGWASPPTAVTLALRCRRPAGLGRGGAGQPGKDGRPLWSTGSCSTRSHVSAAPRSAQHTGGRGQTQTQSRATGTRANLLTGSTRRGRSHTGTGLCGRLPSDEAPGA